jgi:hypothetical protein
MKKLYKKQPHFSQDQSLNHPQGYYYSSASGSKLVERHPESIEYPEFRQLTAPSQAKPVFPDEFIGVDDDGDGLPNDIMPEVFKPKSILGGKLTVKNGNKFDEFLLELRQRCRNYNLDLYRLRQYLYDERILLQPNPAKKSALTNAFNSSATLLADWLEEHDPLDDTATSRVFEKLAVEFIKINGYIASIRAAATDVTSASEIIFSSSSHISISSMFSSF